MQSWMPAILIVFGLGGLLLVSTETFQATALSMLQESPGVREETERDEERPPRERRAYWSPRFLNDYRDGQEDCTEELQAAIDSGMGRIRFPKGVFRISQPIVIDLDAVGYTALDGGGVAQLLMTGPGPAIVVQGTHQGTAAPRTVTAEVWERQRTPMIDGLEILGAHPAACGIEASGTMQLTITRTVVRKALHGIRLTGRNRNVILSECHLYENAGIGVFLDQLNLHQINIANCHISYNKQGGVVSRLSEIRNLQIGVCDIEGNMGEPGEPAAANIELDARGTSLGEVTIVGCTIQHSNNADQSANIRINGDSNPVRFTPETRHSNITIADNIISDVQHNLEIRNMRGITITGNTIAVGFENNLWLENCAHVVVANNVLERNPRYHSGRAATAKHGVLLRDCSDTILSGNLFSGAVFHPAAVMLINCQRMNLVGNSILDYDNGGLLLENVSLSRVSDSIIASDTHPEAEAIRQVNCSNLLLESNLTGQTIAP